MAGATVTPYLGEILQVLLAAFGKYQAKNLLILFDAVATLAEGTLPCPCALCEPWVGSDECGIGRVQRWAARWRSRRWSPR